MRTYTIGEVLGRLKDEFDDITISKIRFLESEGLINPDRTDSGYRKFGDEDIDRLRFVLRAQRDRYLPLKVIREQLDRLDAGLPLDEPAVSTSVDEAGLDLVADDGAPGQPSPAPASLGAPTADVAEPGILATGMTEVSLTLNELCDVTGLAAADIRALAEHGLVKGDATFDGDDLIVAKAAAALMDLGLEARHLRMYRQFADREMSVCEQLVSGLLRQRNPDSRATAQTQLDEITRHGGRLQRTLLARELRGLLRS